MYYSLKLCCLAVLFIGLSGFRISERHWTEYFSNDQVTIDVSENLCDNKQSGISKHYIFLRVSNKTAHKVKVSFAREMWYGDACTGCSGGEETLSTIELEAGASAEGTCESSKDLKIFKEMASGSEGTHKKLSRFNLRDVTVTRIK